MKRIDCRAGVRVVVYHGRRKIIGKVESIDPTTSSLVHVIEDGFNSVHDESPFHISQIRRLNYVNQLGFVSDPARFSTAENKTLIDPALEDAYLTGWNAAIEAAAQKIEDERYDLPSREAEWSRFIARNVRALKDTP